MKVWGKIVFTLGGIASFTVLCALLLYRFAFMDAKETALLTTNQVAALALLCMAALFLCGIALMGIPEKKENKKTGGGRNASVEFCRFVTIMCVVVHHYASSYSPGGYLGVDFFSILKPILI